MEKLNLDNIDIREVLDELGSDYRESGKNIGRDWIGVNCPFCGDDQGHHLGIHMESPVFSCFRCGKTGNILTYVAEELQSFPKAIKLLKKFIPIELRSNTHEAENLILKVELPNNSTKIPSEYQKQYLKFRGYNWKTLHKKYNLSYCDPVGDFANRIIVPVYRRNKLITFTSIDIARETNLRYLHLSENKSITPIKQTLFGIENTNNHSVIVVEGLMDQFRIGDGSVCTWGTQCTNEQILLLSKFSKVFIAFDGDDPGRTAAKKLSNALSVFTDVSIVYLPNDTDPDSIGKRGIKELRALIK